MGRHIKVTMRKTEWCSHNLSSSAMYAMVRIAVEEFDDSVRDDVTFMDLLLREENVVVLPGRAFGLEGGSGRHAFRVVFCAPMDVLSEAAGRIESFCRRHRG